MFDVRSYCSLLTGLTINAFPWRSIWSIKVPKSVSFFLWTARGAILAIDNLVKRETWQNGLENYDST